MDRDRDRVMFGVRTRARVCAMGDNRAGAPLNCKSTRNCIGHNYGSQKKYRTGTHVTHIGSVCKTYTRCNLRDTKLIYDSSSRMTVPHCVVF